MLISKQKPIDEILRYLTGEENIFLVGCKGCAEGCETGGEPQVLEMQQRLREAGKRVTGFSLIDFACNEQLTRMTLAAHDSQIAASDSLLMLCCGSGVQAAAAAVDKAVHPGCNTVSLGGSHAEWREGERCLECGDCVLDYTGGICPVAGCPKNLFHGPCGGSRGGRCEVHPDLPCVWQLIVERLTKLGKADKVDMLIPPKNWGVSLTGGPPPPPVSSPAKTSALQSEAKEV